MESNPTWIPVVALALYGDAGRLLMQKRPAHKHHGGLWELPGGKVENGETPRLALKREITEELGIQVETGDLTPSLVADETGDQTIVLIVYTCRRWTGEVTAREGQEWGWFTLQEARKLPMPPMDTDLLARLADTQAV